MRFITNCLTLIVTVMFALAGVSNTAQAQALFTDDFQDRLKDQEHIGNDWTWFQQDFTANTCSGEISGVFGPYNGGGGAPDYPQDNRNYWTASQAEAGAGDSYYRAGLEVPAWEGALSNMMRVYGNRYNTHPGCQRVLIFREMPIVSAGNFVFSFDVAQDQYGAPQNGEIIGAFVKVIKTSDQSYAELLFETVVSQPPVATNPGDVTTARQSIEFTLPAEMEGELLQFGFHSDLSPNLQQSWATSGAYYDNVDLSPAVVVPPSGTFSENVGVPVPFWAYLLMGGLLALLGGTALRSGRKS